MLGVCFGLGVTREQSSLGFQRRLCLRRAGGGAASVPPRPPPFGRCAASNLQYVCYLEAWGDVREFLLILRNLQFHCSYAQFLGTHYPGPNFLLLYKHLEHYFSIFFQNFFKNHHFRLYNSFSAPFPKLKFGPFTFEHHFVMF